MRLVVSDFDGTLLNWKERRITPRTARAVRAFCRRGGHFVCATARPWYALRPYLGPLADCVSTSILCNGAWVREGREDILLRPVRPEAVRRLVADWWDSPEVRIMLIGRDRTLTNRWSPHRYIRGYQRSLRSRPVPAGRAGDAEVLNIEVDAVPEVLERVESSLAGCGVVCARSWPAFMEVYDASASKGKALEFVRTRLGVAKEEVVAFGDGNNDLDLIEAAGLGVAVANATPEMKRKAAVVTAACNDDGVAQFLERMLAGEAG